MLQITCPFCGARNESEFTYGGPIKPQRPASPGELSDVKWTDYLITQHNPIGAVKEKWWHVRGCGQWLTIVRNTNTHEVVGEETDYQNG